MDDAFGFLKISRHPKVLYKYIARTKVVARHLLREEEEEEEEEREWCLGVAFSR